MDASFLGTSSPPLSLSPFSPLSPAPSSAAHSFSFAQSLVPTSLHPYVPTQVSSYSLTHPPHSLSKIPAIDDDTAPCDPTDALSGQENRDARNILGPTGAAPRVRDIQALQHGVAAAGRRGIQGLEEMRVREAGLDRVDVDLVGRVLERGGAREVQHRALARTVRRRAHQAGRCQDRRQVDDPAARGARRGGERLLRQHLRHRVFCPEPHPAHIYRERGVEDRDRCLVDPGERACGCAARGGFRGYACLMEGGIG